MKKREFVAGVDGGGTKTLVVLEDRHGGTQTTWTGGPSNFQMIGVDEAAKVIVEGVRTCCAQASVEQAELAAVFAGLTGAGRDSDRNRMRASLESQLAQAGYAAPRVRVDSDARIALEGAFGGEVGIILIGGTGSIAFGKGYDGTIYRVGGWGRILGDEGSGFSIGREGLNLVARHLDGRIRSTILTQLVAEKLNLTDQDQIIIAVYRENFDVASVAPLVIEAAAQHDMECERILNKATFDLTEHVRTMTLKIERAARGRPRQKIPLALLGSVLTSDTVFRKILKHKITFSLPQITIVPPKLPPAGGAILMAQSLLGNN